MAREDNPTGLAYLKTFQALFQIIEFMLLLIAWSLLASQPFYIVPGLSFAVGTYVFIWLITIFFFVFYITGAHVRLQKVMAARGTGEATGTSSTLAPPPETHRLCTGSAWFVIEYIVYSVCFLFLFVAVCIVTSNSGTNTHFIAAYAFGWLSLIVFVLHFCLLVRNTEGMWPHQCLMRCCQLAGQARSSSIGEKAGLLPTESAGPSAPEQP